MWPWSDEVKAEEAELERSRQELAKVREQRAMIHVIADIMLAHRERNHFGDRIAEIYRGNK